MKVTLTSTDAAFMESKWECDDIAKERDSQCRWPLAHVILDIPSLSTIVSHCEPTDRNKVVAIYFIYGHLENRHVLPSPAI